MESQFSQTLKWLPNLVAFIAACYGIAFQRSVIQSSRPLLPTNSEPQQCNRAYARFVFSALGAEHVRHKRGQSSNSDKLSAEFRP